MERRSEQAGRATTAVHVRGAVVCVCGGLCVHTSLAVGGVCSALAAICVQAAAWIQNEVIWEDGVATPTVVLEV